MNARMATVLLCLITMAGVQQTGAQDVEADDWIYVNGYPVLHSK
jgi:hypothetical protein